MKRIALAQDKISKLFPFDAEKVKNITEDTLPWIDLLINRFGILQDIIGAKLIDVFLEQQQESSSHLSMVYKINTLNYL